MIVVQIAIAVACLASLIWWFVETLRYFGRAAQDEKSGAARRQLGRAELSGAVSFLLLFLLTWL